MRAIFRVPLSIFTVNEIGTIVLGAAFPKNLVKSPVCIASAAAFALPPRCSSSCFSEDHAFCCWALSDAVETSSVPGDSRIVFSRSLALREIASNVVP